MGKKYSIAVFGVLALCVAGGAAAKLPPPLQVPKENLEAARSKAADKAKADAQALAKAYDRAVANYKSNRKRAAALTVKKPVAQKAAAAKSKPAASGAKSAAAKAAEAKKQTEALGRAQDRAVVNYRRNKGLPVAEAPKIRRNEKLACFTGTEDRHARIGVELVNEQVAYFAYYSKWKPRTCSIEARRDGPYSQWEINGTTSKITLIDHKGVMVIERKGRGYRFAFLDVDRERYCGMDGKINGSLTVTRGSSKCVLQGVMDGHGD